MAKKRCLGCSLLTAALSIACGGDADSNDGAFGGSSFGGSGPSPGASSGTGGAEASAGADAMEEGGSSASSGDAGRGLYAVGTMVFSEEGTTSYVTLLDSLGAQTFDLRESREFGGQADLWVYDGHVFVASSESQAITKFEVRDRRLVEVASVSFANFGTAEFGFWRTIFVSSTKAYFLNGSSEYIVWDPNAMAITGTIELPPFPPRGDLRAFPGYSDRAAVIRDGLLYQPFYWTDETYFAFSEESAIVVLDTTTDTFKTVIDAPCPGLDHATIDDTGTIYFSPWIFAAGGAVVLDQPPTCVVRLARESDEASVAFHFEGIAEGREGAAMRYLGNGKALISVFHDERFELTSTTDVRQVTYGPNWRFWTHDLQSGAASPVNAMDWNAGALYAFDIDRSTYLLVPGGDYSKTTVFDLTRDEPQAVFETSGWSTRLFAVR